MITPISLEIARVLLPFIHLFGLYVMIFGHLSPGGGFAGGSILGAGMILQRTLFKQTGETGLPPGKLLYKALACCLLCYGILKCLHFFGSVFPGGLHIPVGVQGAIFSGGTLMPLNILIGLSVAITFYFIANLFEEGISDHE